MNIKNSVAVLCAVPAFLVLSMLGVSGVEYTDEISAPGGTACNAAELHAALGGDDAANIDENGIITLVRDVHLTETVTLSGGSYELRGAGSIITCDRSAFVLRDGAFMTVGVEGDAGSEPSLSFTASQVCGESLAVVEDEASLTVNSGVVFSGGKTEYGGAVYVNGGKFILSGGNIYDCEASEGGGVYLSDGEFNILGGTVSGCRATKGAGVYAESGKVYVSGGCIGKHSNIGSDGSSIEYGEKNISDSGAGLYISKSAQASLLGGEISGNDGSGIYIADGGVVELSGTEITSNRAKKGGGICNYGTVSAEKSNVSKNEADIGGGIWNAGEYTVSSGQCIENTALLRGGGIYNEGELVLSYGSVVRNTASAGGGIYNTGSFDFCGGTVGHCKLSEDGVGSAVMNSGDMNMSGKAFVYGDNTVALEIASGNVSAVNISGEFDGADIMMTVETVSQTTGIDGVGSYRKVSCVGLEVLRGDPELVASASHHVRALINERSYEIDESGTVKGGITVSFILIIAAVFAVAVAASVVVLIVRKKHAAELTAGRFEGDESEKEDR